MVVCLWAGLSTGVYSHMADLLILAGQRPLHPDPDADVCRSVGESPGRAPGPDILWVPDRQHLDRFLVWRGYVQRCHVQHAFCYCSP